MTGYLPNKIETLFVKNQPKQPSFFIILLLLLFILCVPLHGCKRFVEVAPPKTEIVSKIVFSTDASAKAAMDGIYSRMASSSGFAGGGLQSTGVLAGLSADEWISYTSSATIVQFYQNSITATNGSVLSYMWSEPYQYIYTANAIIEGLSNNPGISSSVIQELTGEAKFIRAFCYFYLVNFFGDVPLYLNTDYRQSSVSVRTSKSVVYQQIINDLISASETLPADYSFSNNERVRPNKFAAMAMLARTYLFLGDWVNAETRANIVIASPAYAIGNDFSKVFTKNSTEAIWQLMPNQTGYNTNEGRYFILSGIPSNFALSVPMINSFEPGDKRKINWTGNITVGGSTYYYPFKYKIQSGTILSEYSMVLRLAEIYLIRAEARTRLGRINDAQSDINLIRARAGLSKTSAATTSDLINAIMHERKCELFTEWGHRWLDLKRTALADSVLSPIKSGNWQSSDVLYPIPQQEIQNNSRIIQNPGY